MEKYLCKTIQSKCAIKLFYLTLLLTFITNLGAQAPDTSRINIELGLTGNIQTGNFERLQFINQLKASFKSKDRKWEFMTRHLYLFQKVFGNKSQDDYLTRNFMSYRLYESLDAFGAIFVEKYLIKRIDLHYQFGTGFRFSIIKSPRSFIQLGLMGSYSNKNYLTADFADFDNNGNSRIETFFISPVFNSRFIVVPKRVTLTFLAWYQQGIGISQNWRFNIETALLVPIHSGLSMKVSFNNFYENINLIGAKANDTFLTYGLSYQFR